MPEEDAARKLVTEFIKSYYEWEKSAYARAEATDTEYLEDGVTYISKAGEKLYAQFEDEYAALLAPYVADSVKIQCPGWGMSPKHDPEYESIVSVVRRDDALVVRTELVRDIHGVTMTDRHEYYVISQDGEPRLTRVMYLFEDGEDEDDFDTL